MAKSSKKDLQAKKRAKRREALKTAPEQPWDGIDVSAWFDTSFLADDKAGESCGLLSRSGFYETGAPAEVLQSWWAAVHPDEEKEVRAARLAASLHQAGKKAEQSPGGEAEAQYAAQKKAVLPELKRLADEGIVTANAVLGVWCGQGVNVGKNTRKALKHLLFAAEKGDPYCCCILASAGVCPDRTEEFYRKSREGCCPSAYVMQGTQCLGGKMLPDAEFEVMLSSLAAFAVNKVYPCLEMIVMILGKPAAARFRQTYAGPMLDLVREAALAGVAAAAELLGAVLMEGVLCERDIGKARELYKEAMQRGSEQAACLYACCLLVEAQGLSGQEKNERMQEGYAILRENCRKKSQLEKSCTLLGSCLVRSDDDKEFKEGMACLKKCLGSAKSDVPVWGAVQVVVEQKPPKRRAQALALLDAAARTGSAEALYWRGLYTLMGMYGQEARKDGIELLMTAGQKGKTEAWAELAGLYALGLYGCRVNSRKALLMAIEGSEKGSGICRLFRVLLEFGEFSRAVKSTADLVREPRTSAGELDWILDEVDSTFTDVVDDMLWLEATEVSAKIVPYYTGANVKPHPVSDFQQLVEAAADFSGKCAAALKKGQILFAGFCAHALKKISRTEYGMFYSGALAVRLGLPHDASAAEVLRFLNRYLADLPESFYQFKDREEDPDLEKKTAAWTEYLRNAVEE